jgi:hypothetical protein
MAPTLVKSTLALQTPQSILEAYHISQCQTVPAETGQSHLLALEMGALPPPLLQNWAMSIQELPTFSPVRPMRLLSMPCFQVPNQAMEIRIPFRVRRLRTPHSRLEPAHSRSRPKIGSLLQLMAFARATSLVRISYRVAGYLAPLSSRMSTHYLMQIKTDSAWRRG